MKNQFFTREPRLQQQKQLVNLQILLVEKESLTYKLASGRKNESEPRREIKKMIHRFFWGFIGGTSWPNPRGYFKKFHTGMFRTCLAPYPFTYHLASEITPFVNEPSIEKGTPFWRSLPIEAFVRISPQETNILSHVLPTLLLTRF